MYLHAPNNGKEKDRFHINVQLFYTHSMYVTFICMWKIKWKCRWGLPISLPNNNLPKSKKSSQNYVLKAYRLSQ